MIEIPEVRVLAGQIGETLSGRCIEHVVAGYSPHKFAWYYEDPSDYPSTLVGRTITGTTAYGGRLEVAVDDAVMLFGEGVALRCHLPGAKRPAKHQLLVEFDDGSALTGSVQMYGGLWCFPKGAFDDYYYKVAREKPSPLGPEFNQEYFDGLLSVPGAGKLSAKAFLATEQRIPGLGNGVLQDILYNAGIHPRSKVQDLTVPELEKLYVAVRTTLKDMFAQGGRDTEKDLFGNPGGYPTRLSSKTHGQPCLRCGSLIAKESYMGGAIYFCATCQER